MNIIRYSFAALAAASLAAPMSAQPTEAYDAPGAINSGEFQFSAGAEIVSIYVFRGFEVQDDGFIIQPWAELSTNLGDSGFSLTAGIWNSLGSDGSGAGSNSPSFALETDLYVGTSYTLDQFTFGATLTGFYSPGGFFGDVEEISVQAAYDDSAYLEEWAFNPYALIAFEFRDENGSEDVYLEIGGAFNAPFIDSEELAVELTFPFALGFSLDDYYTDAGGDNEFFGFLKIGAQASTPLDFIPAQYGSWTGTAGIDLFFLNDDAGLNDGGDEFLPVLKVGVSLSY